MINNVARIGNFTSSEIVALTAMNKAGTDFGKPALTYIEECNMERRLGRSLTDESNARPLTWGKLVEVRVFELLGLEYVLSSTETDMHPTIDCWAGSKDGIKQMPKTIIDIKSPITLKSFCQLVDPIYDGFSGLDAMECIRNNHKDGEKYYWQLVSNSIINNSEFAELIVYMPYESELEEIKRMAANVHPDQLSKHYWIAMAQDGELPFIKDGGFYKNLNVINFQVPLSDKAILTQKVLKAKELLIDRTTGLPSITKKDLASGTPIDIKNIPLTKIA
jgi:hypothetical protein